MNRILLQHKTILLSMVIALSVTSTIKSMKRSMRATEKTENSKRQKITESSLVNENEPLSFTDLPTEIQERIIAETSNKDNLRRTNKALKKLASRNSPNIIQHDPLHLTEKAYQFQLMRALNEDKEEVVTYLKERYNYPEKYSNATIRVLNANESMNALTIAAFNDDIKGVKKFITDKTQYHHPQQIRHEFAVLLSPAFIAVYFGYLDLLEYLLDENFLSLTEKTNNYYSLLHIAAQGDSPEMTQFLLDLNNNEDKYTYFNINAETKYGLTPIMLATSHNKIENIKLLLQHGASIERQGDHNDGGMVNISKEFAIQYYPDFYATATGNLKLLQYIKNCQTKDQEWEGGINNKITEGFWSLMHIAAENDYPEITQFLIDEDKVDCDQDNSEGMTPLHIAAQHNNIENMQLLLDAKANPFGANNKNETIMGTAIFSGCTDAVKLLLPYYKSAYKSAQEKELWLPFATKEYAIEYAQEKGFEEIATMLNE